MKVYEAIVNAWTARENCMAQDTNNPWIDIWTGRLERIEKNVLPNGSGFDSDPCIMDASEKRITIHGAYHCMNDVGYYDGWIEFSVVVNPSLLFGFTVDVKARGMTWPRRYADMREYISECYAEALRNETED